MFVSVLCTGREFSANWVRALWQGIISEDAKHSGAGECDRGGWVVVVVWSMPSVGVGAAASCLLTAPVALGALCVLIE